MTKTEIITLVEKYVREQMAAVKEESHGFRHVDRVRRWAFKIGAEEGGVDLFLLEIAALLHDVGRSQESKRENHAVTSERLARKFLTESDFFTAEERETICDAVLKHGLGGRSQLVKVLRDADRMDLFGAVAVARAFTWLHDKPYYIDEDSFAGGKWKDPADVQKNISNPPWHESIVDCLNFCLDVYDNMDTATGKRLAQEKVEYLRGFVEQLKKETVGLE